MVRICRHTGVACAGVILKHSPAEYVDSIRWSVLTKARTAALAWPSRA